jgi:hypothetical protein
MTSRFALPPDEYRKGYRKWTAIPVGVAIRRLE